MRILFAALALTLFAPLAAQADIPVANANTQVFSFVNLGSPTQINTGARTVYWVAINNTQAVATFVQLFDAATTPTLGTAVADQATCPATSYCFIVLGGGIRFPTGAWVGAATAINGSSAAASGNQVYVGAF